MKSVAPKETMLEDFQSRMKWIVSAAYTFHGMMQKQTSYMESQLNAIAAWVDVDQSRDMQAYTPPSPF